ncbi:MAG: alpha/beta hydrolase-fold protein, partial [Planctomycetota bacterium]
TEELLPALEEVHDLTARAEERGVLGTSLGGVAAAVICARHRSTIGLAAAQSPALWVVPGAFEEIVAADDARPARAFVSWGTVHDGARKARALAELYRRRGAPVTAMERNEGHSWGQWRALLDDALVTLFPAGEN